MRREIKMFPAWRETSGSRAAEALFDALIAEIAARQHGVISRLQLLGIGMSSSAIGRRMDAGNLHPIHEGVYAVGHPAITREGELIAAVLAGGDGAVLSHASAAELWELPLAKDRLVHAVARSNEERPGIKFHHAVLAQSEITVHKRIRVTTPERTVIDVANGLSIAQIEHLIRQAEYDHLVTHASLVAVAEAHRGARGMKHLSQALGLSRESKGTTRSKLERRFLGFIRKHGLPVPELNHRIELSDRTVFADAAWPSHRLIAELDSRRVHDNSRAFESDRARDRALLVAGWTTTRVTWRQLHEDQHALAADLRALLAEIRIFPG